MASSTTDHPRRSANAAPPESPSIPPAPPLPPPRTTQPARSAFARFVPFSGYTSARPTTTVTGQTAGGGRDGSSKTSTYAPKIAGYNPHAPQHTSFKTKAGSEIAAFDINQERTHAILAGRDLLETISVAGTYSGEETNLRAAIINNERLNSGRSRENLDIHDVKWSHSAYNSTIATAATNGKVIIYDLNRPGIEVARLHEHHRQVHKLAFNPHQGALLLSGSHDATVKLWDLRDMRSDVMTCRSRTRFNGQSDGIRDLKWSPTDVFELAFGTDIGVIQGWDSRFPKSAKLKLNAHDGRCTAIDWHPDGKHLLSAGQDKYLKVWDFSSEQRRQKPSWTLKTPYPLMLARWRPPCRAGDGQGQEQGPLQCSQVITSYERTSSAVINLWDFRRPFMPFREMWTSSTPPTDMLWHSTDRLWSTSRDGTFYQTDMKFTAKTIDRRPLTSFALSPHGELVVFQQKRARHRGSEFDYAIPNLAFPGARRGSRSTPREADLGRSSADDSIDDSFLSSSYQNGRHHERTLSNRSTKSVSGTPPALQDGGVAKLSETLNETKRTFQPRQIAFRGQMDGLPNPQHLSYLAQKYKTTALPDHPTVEDYLNVHKVFEKNAKYADKTSASRTAQTWRLFGAVLQRELILRATFNKRRRQGMIHAKRDPLLILPKVLESSREQYEKQRKSLAAKAEARGLLNLDAFKAQESSSNVPTPIARPVQISVSDSPKSDLPDPDFDEQLSLPESVMPRGPVKSSLTSGDALSVQAKSLRPTFEGPSWYGSANDLTERKAMMSTYRAPIKQPLDFDTPSKQTTSAINIPPPLDRHNSDESFAMFSASSGSKGGISVPASYSSALQQSMGSIPEHMQPRHQDSFAYSENSYDNPIPGVTESSQSSSSKEDIFNADYATSLQLSDSPLGSRTTSSLQYSDDSGNMNASGTIIPEDTTLRFLPPDDSAAGTVSRAVPTIEYSKQHTSADLRPKSMIPPNIFRTDQTPQRATDGATAGKTTTTGPTLSNEELDRIPFILDDFTDTRWLLEDVNYPITIGKLLEEIFMYNSQAQPDVQQIYHLLAILKPFLPGSVVLAPSLHKSLGRARLAETKEGLENYARWCIKGLNLTIDDTIDLLSDPLAHLVRFRIALKKVEIACSNYEDMLYRAKLWDPLVRLRTLCAMSFGTFKQAFLAESKVGIVCLHCDKPMPSSKNSKCGTCRKQPDPCPVCWQASSPFTVTKRHRREIEALASMDPSDAAPVTADEPLQWPSLWQACLSCGHGCHAACMVYLQDHPETAGCCPEPGCGCPCLPGLYRDRVIREAEEEKAFLSAGSVRTDERRVGESSAVKRAMGILDEGKRVQIVEPEK